MTFHLWHSYPSSGYGGSGSGSGYGGYSQERGSPSHYHINFCKKNFYINEIHIKDFMDSFIKPLFI